MKKRSAQAGAWRRTVEADPALLAAVAESGRRREDLHHDQRDAHLGNVPGERGGED